MVTYWVRSSHGEPMSHKLDVFLGRNLSSAGAVAEEAESVLVALDFINSRVHFPCFELRFAFNAPLAPAS